MSTAEPPCELVQQVFTAYLNGSLSRSQRAEIGAHLQGCPRCQRYHIELQAADAGLSCRELVELVTAYLEGALPPEQQARFEGHLALCEGCRRYLVQMRELLGMVGQLREEDIPMDARNALLATFRSWKRGEALPGSAEQ